MSKMAAQLSSFAERPLLFMSSRSEIASNLLAQNYRVPDGILNDG